jgi:hypothetical protein
LYAALLAGEEKIHCADRSEKHRIGHLDSVAFGFPVSRNRRDEQQTVLYSSTVIGEQQNDFDHAFLNRHIGIGVARVDQVFDAVAVVIEGLKGLPGFGEVAG